MFLPQDKDLRDLNSEHAPPCYWRILLCMAAHERKLDLVGRVVMSLLMISKVLSKRL